MTYFLGIDVSTTATKALLVDERGRVAAVASSTYDLSTRGWRRYLIRLCRVR